MEGTEEKPLRREYSREEITEAARKWLRENYPPENTAESVNRWCERFGLLVHFLHEHFPTNRVLSDTQGVAYQGDPENGSTDSQ